MEDRDREAAIRLGKDILSNPVNCSSDIQMQWELANKEYEK